MVTASDKKWFGGNREIAIQRDGEKCVTCGMTRVEHKTRFDRDITVDHIDGNGCNTPKHLRNNALHNLQTLCLPCHGKKDVKRHKSTTRKFIKGRKFTKNEVVIIKGLLESGSKQIPLAKRFGVSQTTISYIKLRKLDFYKD